MCASISQVINLKNVNLPPTHCYNICAAQDLCAHAVGAVPALGGHTRGASPQHLRAGAALAGWQRWESLGVPPALTGVKTMIANRDTLPGPFLSISSSK